MASNHYIPFRPNSLQPAGFTWEKEKLLRRDAEVRWAEYNASYEPQLVLFEKLKQLYPDNAWITAQLAFVNMQLGRYKTSYKLYDSLFKLAPKIAAPWYLMSNCIFSDRIKKETLLKRKLKAVPDDTFAMHSLADMYKNSNRIKEACDYYLQIANMPRGPWQLEKALEEIENNKCVTEG